ncbi:hypothetical protein ACJRO7_004084 [Eucalyptus globulus]|uniref:Disease resistance R13L4/SHOC-2-like LRR domain-containing protein n=1 Tax=Eucalyptus globulus TaxID=34317 RepID=A0ABD3IZE1_EUCGL
MKKFPYESMSGDMKDKTEVQSWEEIVQAIQNIMDTNLSEDKLVMLENLVQHYRKVKSFLQHRENQRKWAEESKKLLTTKLQPSESNLCLLSLVIFPENSIIKKRISQRGEKMAEQVGEEVYNELLQQGLIEPDAYLGGRRSRLFYFESKDKTSREDLKNLSSSCLHLIVGGRDSPQHDKLAKDEHIHTMFNVNQQYIELQSGLLSNMKQSAKFLSLRGISTIVALLDSTVELVSLEILDLRACHNLEKLPEDIASLKKLMHLDISECYLIERMPKGTDKLSSLQVLKGFVIGWTARKNNCRISDLRKLTKLRRLSICIGRGAAIGAREFASLKEVASLFSLTISWRVTSLASQSILPEDQFLPKQLEKLELIGMPMASIPKCLNPQELENLKKLERRTQLMAPLVYFSLLRLKHLRSLRIGNDEDVLKKFPRLKYFEKINCADDNVLWYKSRAV